jgi:adsorption protein B
VAALLLPLAVWILVSGLDDLFLDLACAWGGLRRRGEAPLRAAIDQLPEKRTAIFVPLWREAGVIAGMLEHNIAAIRYGAFDFFVGAYPNDEATLAVVRGVAQRFSNVHLAVCPHDGPTSKADCLNWVYQRMLLWEEERSVRFEVVVVHDAEDLVHPEELRWINYYIGQYGMVQIPVLPLATPFREFTHGVYCDEFAEFQTKDVPARQALGGFIPSNGVGTGYARWALERVADAASNRLFEPGCLTEDYENGFRLRQLGCPQLFVPIQWLDGQPVATREFFPRRFRQALRQRTRWVMGIALQGWERHGWSGGARQVYWWWRDRKGLVGNPASLAANLMLAYGVATWLWSRWSGGAWGIGDLSGAWLTRLLLYATVFLQSVRIGVRCACVARIYGFVFALGVPLRAFWANGLNFLATASALARYTRARLRHEPLVWVKTEHVYPSRAALMAHKRPLGEVLVRTGYVSEAELADARASKPAGVRLGEYLVSRALLTERDLYEALSLQQNVSFTELSRADIPVWVARTLPAAVSERWRVLPFKVSEGRLYLAGPELPSDEMHRELRKFTRLAIEFKFITPSNLAVLQQELLGEARRRAG